jgi:hypothetical protein
MQFSPFSRHVIALRSKYPPQNSEYRHTIYAVSITRNPCYNQYILIVYRTMPLLIKQVSYVILTLNFWIICTSQTSKLRQTYVGLCKCCCLLGYSGV